MITQEEYDTVQVLLGRKGNPRPKKHDFPFRGLIRCGECGGVVTPDGKNQVICSKCRYKFSSINKRECLRCRTPVDQMVKPTILKYVYYHCTKRRNPHCSQGSIEARKLEQRIDEALSGVQISERLKDWTIKYLKEDDEKEIIASVTFFIEPVEEGSQSTNIGLDAYCCQPAFMI